ncbi:MAG TPA: aminotransferase class V-fold PLP-dependent enzyme [Candidatus Polarisedimenticolia bacterium]|nr:aminotransferase class V-fold PLP-dependent enzyme [Candidatus Polarisedimenticolia bacterium]
MELAVRSLVRHRMLVVIAGSRAERYATIGEACGRDVARACVPPGQAMRPEWLDRFLRSPDFDAVAVVQQEDAQGEPMPLAELAPVVRRSGALLIADVSFSVGHSPVQADQWGLDLVFAGGEGGSPIPSWLVLGAASSRALQRAQSMPGRGQALDLVAHHAAAAEGTTLDPLPEPRDAVQARILSALQP